MLCVIPVQGLPLIEEGDDLASMILERLAATGHTLKPHDVLVVAQKIVSKSEGRTVTLEDVVPSEQALELAAQCDKDARLVELIVRESQRILRIRPGLMVVEDTRGFVCANAGIDRSNIQQHGPGEEVALLPLDGDRSATALRERVRELTGISLAVIINDSHGRAWREGTVGVAIGMAGTNALSDRRGEIDLTGYTLEHTIIGLADEIASAASLLMGPAAEGVPAVVVRGLQLPEASGSARDLQRPAHLDLFR